MRLLLCSLLQLAVVAGLIVGSTTASPPTLQKQPVAGPREPFSDTFYNAPEGFESAKPGTILRYRNVPKPIVLNGTAINLIENAWQIQYRTQNSVGHPEAAIVTVIKPKNGTGKNLFSESYFTNACYAECGPSMALQSGNRDDNLFVQFQTLVVVAALNQGWHVSVADDIGPQGAYPAGLQMGYATLDSIRAVKNSRHITGIDENPLTTMSGYSAGGISVAWATELQPTYAPELKIAGAALGGLIPNLTNLLTIATELNYSNLAVPAINGLAHDYANLTKWLDENLVPETAKEFRMANKQCLASNSMFTGKDLGAYFKGGMDSFLWDPIPRSVVVNAGTMGGVATPKIPWFLYETIGDNLSPVHLTDNLYDKLCKGGATIEYERNIANLSHFEEGFIGFKGALNWIKDRHTSKGQIKNGCATVPVNLSSIMAVAPDLLGQFPPDLVPIILPLFEPIISGGSVGYKKRLRTRSPPRPSIEFKLRDYAASIE